MGTGVFMLKNAQEFAKTAAESVPRTPQQAVEVLKKVQAAYQKEITNAGEVVTSYQRAATGDATPNEIASANKKAKKAMVAARFAALMALPGAIFMIPALNQIDLSIIDDDLVPDSVKEQFGL
jgi:hypothetical protein